MKPLRSNASRVVAVSLGVPLLLAAVAQSALTATSWFAHSSEKHSASYAWNGGTVSLQADSGDVTVGRSTSNQVTVAYTEHYGLKKPTLRAAKTASGLTLSSTCPGDFLNDFCAVNYTVLVPAGANVDLSTGDGHVTLTRLDGDVKVHSGDGTIEGTQLDVAHLSADTGDGSVNLDWAGAPTSVDIQSGDGSLHITVPQGSGPYAIDHQTGDGSTDIAVLVSENATRTMKLHTGDGDLSVR